MKIYVIYNNDFSMDDNIEQSEIDRVCDALLELGHLARPYFLNDDDFNFPFSPFLHGDLVFNLFEGFSNNPESEISVVEKLEEREIPFTGNSSKVLKLTLDKVETKQLLCKNGIETPSFVKVNSLSDIKVSGLSFPLIVKPNKSDASNDIDFDSVVYKVNDLVDKVKILLSLHREIIIEEYIEGREFNVGLLGKKGEMKVTSISEIIYNFPLGAPKILTFGSKWRKDSIYFDNSFAVCPADIDERMFSDICDIAIKSCNVIDCEGYARVDFRQDEKGNNYVLEVNANPDLSDDAGFVLQAKQIGLSYRDLIGEIVRIGCENNCLG